MGFVKGRSILNNNFLAQEVWDWPDESNQNLVLLTLDFEKTFDTIERDFLFFILSKLGFFPEWVKWVLALHWHSTSEIKINGKIGDTFSLHKSVKQGCPLAPYLFILATNISRYMLQDPKVQVEGLTLPKGGMLKDQTFANDITFYLNGTKDNMDKAKKVLNTFYLASGAHINWHKPCTIWATKTRRNWNWGKM